MATNRVANFMEQDWWRYQTNVKVATIATSTVLLIGTVGVSDQALAQNQTAEKNAQVIKVKLTEIAGVSEWVRIETSGNRVKLFHSITTPSGISRALRSVVPFNINNTWYDHPTTRIVFQPDGCQETALPVNYSPSSSSNCLVIGREAVDLPTGTSLYNGKFTIEYIRNDLPRSVTFKVPQQSK